MNAPAYMVAGSRACLHEDHRPAMAKRVRIH